MVCRCARARPRGSRRGGAVVERAFAGAVEFRMPLHRGHEGRAGLADRLDHAVARAARLDHEAGGQVLDALVVDAVDRCPRRALEDLRQPSARHELDLVEVAVVARRIAMPHRRRAAGCRCPGAACRHAPRSSPAGRGRCRAPACRAPRRRRAGPARSRRAPGRRCQRVVERRLAVARRRHVGAALEHQGVEPVGVVVQADVALSACRRPGSGSSPPAPRSTSPSAPPTARRTAASCR